MRWTTGWRTAALPGKRVGHSTIDMWSLRWTTRSTCIGSHTGGSLPQNIDKVGSFTLCHTMRRCSCRVSRASQERIMFSCRPVHMEHASRIVGYTWRAQKRSQLQWCVMDQTVFNSIPPVNTTDFQRASAQLRVGQTAAFQIKSTPMDSL